MDRLLMQRLYSKLGAVRLSQLGGWEKSWVGLAGTISRGLIGTLFLII